MSRLSERYRGDGLIVLAVNAWDEPKEVIKRFVKQQNLRHRILLDGAGVAENYGLYSVPVVLWIDRKGNVVDAEADFHGPKSLEKKTKRLLSSNPG